MTTETDERAQAAPKAKGLREPAFLVRQPTIFWDSISLNAEQWRRLVGQAPVVRSCIQTLVMQITGLNWSIDSEDERLAQYFTDLLNGAEDGAGFEDLVARVVEDTLTMPFGGAWEIGSYSDGTVAWLAHLDAALMKPTYRQDFPYAQIDPWVGALNMVLFRPDEVSRIKWQPQTSIRLYGWTKTPCMDCLPAIQGLLRSDRFWQTMMTDSPPAGVLDIPGFEETEARDWLEGWKTQLAGIDSLKVPVLYGSTRDKQATFISFAQSATETQLPELVRRYAELVTAAFGMNIGDLGLFGQELRLAGATKLIELSKRQGLAHLLRRIKQRLNSDVLPDACEFKWEDVELEDTIRRESARKLGAERLAILADPMVGIITADEARRQAVEDGLLTIELDESAPGSAGTAPTGDKAVTSEGKPKGERERHRPFGPAPRLRGTEAELPPPRAFPTTSKAAREMGRLVGPWLAGIAAKATRARLGTLLDAGLAAAKAAGGMTGATATVRARTPSPAEQAIEALLRNDEWWRAPDIADRVAAALDLAYREGLLEAAGDIQRDLAKAGLVKGAAVGVSVTEITDPAVLKALTERAYGIIRHVDIGTDFFIRREIMTGVQKGLGPRPIARNLLLDEVRRGVVETFRGRALSIVNTEVNWAATQATLKQQASVRLTKRVWRTLPSACDLCKRNAKRGPIGPTEHFESVFGPCDGPPSHPVVCRCWVTFDREELHAVAAGGQPQYYTGAPLTQP
ncbi:MAG: hypothetical protein A2V88_08675 [Elusimicrobia bacterium RBG_16_66_12]|nr:MAG: hypothetical protein A2V88_08675 [Elusimicrobia bacterium RBG_16_66_12]